MLHLSDMNDLTNTKLFNLLSCLTRLEWRSFRTFIVSGIAGPIGKSIAFYDLLSVYHPHFHHKELTRELLFKALFKGLEFEDKKLRYAMTDLYSQASMFLKFRALQLHPTEGKYLLITELAERSADKAFLSEYNADEISLSRDAEYYYNCYREDFIYLNQYFPRQKRTGENPIGKVTRNLDNFFVTRKLQLLCEMVNVRNVMAVEYDFILKDEIIRILKAGAFADVPIVTIYFHILMTLTEPENSVHFEKLEQLLAEKKSLFKNSQLRDMYQYLMNFCIKKINQGEPDFVKRLFKIYQFIIENSILFVEGVLSQWDYKNIVVIGLRSEEPIWVYNFIEQYKIFLAESERDNAYTYNLAYYYFGIGEFRKSLSLLRQVEFTDLYYQLDMRAILLKCYFETDDQEAFFYHASAFRVFLNRNKLVSDYQRIIYRNMIKYATRLMKSAHNKKNLELLLTEIEEVKQIADINWLKKKVMGEGFLEK